jgi:hypothetical protein
MEGFMPQAIEVSHATALGKARRPWTVATLCVVTLGVYTCVWYYKVNRELRDFGSARGDRQLAESKPIRSVLAITVGGLLVLPPLISLVRTTGRVRDVERAAIRTPRSRAGLILLMLSSELLGDAGFVRGVGVAFALAGTIGMGLAFGMIQARLNGVWGDERA